MTTELAHALSLGHEDAANAENRLAVAVPKRLKLRELLAELDAHITKIH